jgi:hypothetical protein
MSQKHLKRARHHTASVDMLFKNLYSLTFGKKFSMQGESGSSNCDADLRTSVSSSQLACESISVYNMILGLMHKTDV